MGEPAVGELHRIPAVLPALVGQAGRRIAAFILDIAVAVEVTAVLDPSQGGAGVGLQGEDELVVAAAGALGEHDQAIAAARRTT